jgi:hypothetical protein
MVEGSCTMTELNTFPPEGQPDEPFDLETAPLDPSPFFMNDWGGDGSDLSRPVRAHVLAALVPTSEPYRPPIDELLRLGDARDSAVAARSAALHFEPQHIPELVRVVRDRALNTANSDSLEVWAPIHALEILGDMDISAVVADLIPLLDLVGDWYNRLLPELLGGAGASALEPLQRYLVDRTRWGFGRANAAEALQELAQRFPELREQVVQVLNGVLEQPELNHEIANTAMISALVDLGASDSLPLIRRAFESGQVDEMVRGDWSTILSDLGIEPEPDDPLLAVSAQRFEDQRNQLVPRELRERLQALWDRSEAAELAPRPAVPPAAQTLLERSSVSRLVPHTQPPPARLSAGEQRTQKAKHKRKQAAASRKANRGKKKHR